MGLLLLRFPISLAQNGMEDAGIKKRHFTSHFKPENGNVVPTVYSFLCGIFEIKVKNTNIRKDA